MKDIRLIHVASGETVAFGCDGFILDEYDIGSIEALHKTYAGYSQSGEYRISSRFGRRGILLRFHILADGMDDMEEKKRKLTRVADPVGSFEFCLEKKRVLCVAAGTADFSEKVEAKKGLVARGTLRILCLAPCFYAEDERRVVYGAYTGQLVFPEEATEEPILMGYMPSRNTLRMQNGGDVAAGLTVTVTAKSDCGSFRMSRADGTESFAFNRPIAKGQTLRICTEYGKKSVTLSDGEGAVSAIQYVDPQSDFFRIGVGENIFTYDCGGGDAVITLAMREQYLI
jgi:hypothetical protein